MATVPNVVAQIALLVTLSTSHRMLNDHAYDFVRKSGSESRALKQISYGFNDSILRRLLDMKFPPPLSFEGGRIFVHLRLG